MNCTVVVATSRPDIADHLSLKKEAAIPAGIAEQFAQKNISLSLLAFFSGDQKQGDLSIFMRRAIDSTDGVVILFDEKVPQAREMSDAFYTLQFSSHLDDMTIQNFFGYFFAKALKNFLFYFLRFQNARDQKVFLLPLRNFRADELMGLQDMFSKSAIQPDFNMKIEGFLARINQRRTPKKTENYKDVYLKDDGSFYFKYGYERHSVVETAVPPHNAICELNSRFRFGAKYDDTRHFNVSLSNQDKRIFQEFLDCHRSKIKTANATHINMFPNDFHK